MTQKNFGAFTQEGFGQLLQLAGSQLTTLAAAVTAGTLAAGALTGALSVFILSNATTPGNQTTRTAAQLYADLVAEFGAPLPNGFTYELTITNTGSNTLTLVAGTGVTIVGTPTVAGGFSRTFTVAITPNAVTITSVSIGTYA